MTIEGERFVAIEGRVKDQINRGGEKIAAEEVENLLLRHPRVVEAAVVAVPDPRLGERTCAYVVVDGEQLTLPEVREHFAALEVAKFKWPERLEHLPEIPRTPVGKTDKKRLAADIARKVGTAPVRAGDGAATHAARSAATPPSGGVSTTLSTNVSAAVPFLRPNE